jgi:1,4-alpha-glucan branching enzyme
MPGDRWQQLANVRAYLAFMWAHPGKQLLFMGSELGQEAEWAESRSLDWWLEDTPWHAGLQQLVRDLNRVYKATPSLWARDFDPSGFEWIDANDSAHNTFSFMRWDTQGNPLVCVANFSGIPDEGYRVGLPFGGKWIEVLNTDAELYGGSGVGNLGAVTAEDVSWHGRPASASMRIPPLGAVWFAPEAAPAGAPRVRDRRLEDKPPSGVLVIPPEELAKAETRAAEVRAAAATTAGDAAPAETEEPAGPPKPPTA